MLITGVMPLPADTNSIFSGNGVGSVNSPSTSPRYTRCPFAARCRAGDIVPPGVRLTVMLTQPCGCAGSEVME